MKNFQKCLQYGSKSNSRVYGGKIPLVLNVCECLLIEIAFGDRTRKKAIYILPKSSGIGFYLGNTAQLYSTTTATFQISITYITYLYAKKFREIELILNVVTVTIHVHEIYLCLNKTYIKMVLSFSFQIFLAGFQSLKHHSISS